MYSFATLYALRRHLGIDDTDTSEDTRLIDALSAASANIEQRTRRTFQPRLASIAHDINLRDVRELLLKDDLLTLHSIINGDGTNIALENTMHISDGIVRLTNGRTFIYDETPIASLQVTGIWGYHPNWSEAWRDSEDSIQDVSLTASDTIITVNDADASITPRFQVGQLIRLADEYCHITAVDMVNNTLTVKRGVQGTVASNHTQGTAIEIYHAPRDVAHLTLRWALWLYREPDAVSATLPSDLANGVRALRRLSVYS